MTCDLEIKDLNFSYNNKPVFNGLAFNLSENGIVGLLGLNGAGKSTLLKIIAGILPSDGAQINCISETNSQAKLIGYLPERPLFYPELTVTENILFIAESQKLYGDKLNNNIENTLQQCHLTERRHQLAGNLSKGYQQRLGLAMAIVHQPDLLLLDEPTDGLDPQQIKETHQLIKTFAQQATIIISSHRLDEISRLCNRILILHQGQFMHDAAISDEQEYDHIEKIFSDIIGGKQA